MPEDSCLINTHICMHIWLNWIIFLLTRTGLLKYHKNIELMIAKKMCPHKSTKSSLKFALYFCIYRDKRKIIFFEEFL